MKPTNNQLPLFAQQLGVNLPKANLGQPIFIKPQLFVPQPILAPQGQFNNIPQQVPQQQQSTTCKHGTCAKIRGLCQNGDIKGFGLMLIMKYNGQKWVCMLGKERGGQYKGQYTLCAGKIDQQDNGCVLKTLVREMVEEFKIDMKFGPEFDKMFRDINGNIRFYMKHNTPIFIGVLPSGTSRKPLNAKITQANSNPNLPWCLREMEEVSYFDLKTHQEIDGKHCVLSSFSTQVMQVVYDKVYESDRLNQDLYKRP